MSDQEISQALHSLLHDHYTCPQPPNPNSSSSAAATVAAPPLTSLNAVVQHLESKFGVNLSHKADFIRAQIQQFFFQPQPQPQPPQPPPPQRPKDHFALQQSHNFHLAAPPPPPPPISVASQAFYTFSSPPLQPAVSSPLHKKPQNAAVSADETPKPSKQKRRGGAGGLNKLCGVSPELQAIVGQPTMPRTEIVKQLWAYIRKNNLQDPNNKRKIICNDELRLVFETDCTDMFKMNKLLAKHILPLEPTKEAAAKKQKLDLESPTTYGGPVEISEALANFFGVDAREMLQSEVLTRFHDYINANNLEDPMNPMVILCDAKLQELLGCETLPASRVPEVLARSHMFKT